MSTELKKIIEKDIKNIEKDLKKRNLTAKSVMQTVMNSLNGIVFYAKDGKSIILYAIGLIYEIVMGFAFNINPILLSAVYRSIAMLDLKIF